MSAAYALGHGPLPAQSEVIGAVNAASRPQDVVVCAAGSMPGDLHKLWRTRDPKGYHVEYGYSCMGYEIAGGLGIKMADPDREVFVMVGDGSYLMLSSELVTAVSEGVKLVIVLVDNHGFGSIGALSESVGSQRFGTSYRLPVDFAANARSLGARVSPVASIAELEGALRDAQASDQTTVIVVETDPLVGAPDSEAGGTCPSPRCQSSTAPAPRTPPTLNSRRASARRSPPKTTRGVPDDRHRTAHHPALDRRRGVRRRFGPAPRPSSTPPSVSRRPR